jgi:integration host factor subunit beta
MTKSQLIEIVSGKLPELPHRDAEAIVNTVFERMVEALCRGDRIEIRGFGIFGVKVRGPKRGRNPKTGAAVEVPQRRMPFFIVGKDLRERLNRGPPAELVSSGMSAPESAPIPMAAASRETP